MIDVEFVEVDFPVIKEAVRYLYIHHDRMDQIRNQYKDELKKLIRQIDEERICEFEDCTSLEVLILALEHLSNQFMDYTQCFWVASVPGPFISREMVESTLKKARQGALDWPGNLL